VKNLNFNKTSIIAILLVGVLAFAGGLAAANAYGKVQEEQAQRLGSEFVADILAGNTEAAYSVTNDALREDQSEEQFGELVDALKTDSPNPIEGAVLQGNGRTLFVQYVDGLPPAGEGNTAAEFYVGLEKSGMGWKVSSLSVK